MKYSASLLLLSLCLFACAKSTDEDKTGEISNKIVSFEKIDSIRIEYLGNPIIHDLDPVSRTVLFMEHKESSEEIYVADFEGKILTSFFKNGDSPDCYGALLSTLRIRDDRTFLVNGYHGFMVYDFSGKLQSQVKAIDFQTPSQQIINMGFGMEQMGSRYVNINQAPPPRDTHKYKDFPLLCLLDPETGEKEPFIQFPQNSMFVDGNHFFMKSWFPVFTLDNDRIYVVFGSEPVIYSYETSAPYSIISHIPLTLSAYSYFKGADSSSDGSLFGMSMISGRIENIKKIDEFFVVAYFPGYSSLDIKTNIENKSSDEARIFRESMQKKYPSRIAIVDSLGKLINDFVPDRLEPKSMLVRNGELWRLEKPDEEMEQDYFRLFRVGLRIE